MKKPGNFETARETESHFPVSATLNFHLWIYVISFAQLAGRKTMVRTIVVRSRWNQSSSMRGPQHGKALQ